MSRTKTAATVGGVVLVGLAIFAVLFAIGALIWSWLIMLVVGAAKPHWGWSLWHAMFPWGLIVGFVWGSFTSSLRSVVNRQ
jgi:hypothetical protein